MAAFTSNVVSVGIVSPESASLLERVEEDSERLSLLGSPTGSAATWLRKPFVLSELEPMQRVTTRSAHRIRKRSQLVCMFDSVNLGRALRLPSR